MSLTPVFLVVVVGVIAVDRTPSQKPARQSGLDPDEPLFVREIGFPHKSS